MDHPTISNVELMFMDYGLCIWTRKDNTYQVRKIKTHRSPTDVLHNEEVPDCSVKIFPDIDAAYDFCLKFCEGGVEEANLRECTVQLAYNPTGHAFKIKNLENVKAATPEEAEAMGEEQVKTYFEEIGLTKKVEYELKVRPV
jgi:hypothetical protein